MVAYTSIVDIIIFLLWLGTNLTDKFYYHSKSEMVILGAISQHTHHAKRKNDTDLKVPNY